MKLHISKQFFLRHRMISMIGLYALIVLGVIAVSVGKASAPSSVAHGVKGDSIYHQTESTNDKKAADAKPPAKAAPPGTATPDGSDSPAASSENSDTNTDIVGGLAAIPTCASGLTVTGKINTYFSSQPNGSTISFPANQCYIVDSVIHLEKRRNLTIDGNNSTFKRTVLTPDGIAYPQWDIKGGDSITIKNMTIQGMNSKAKYNAQHEHDANVSIKGSTNVTLDNITGANAGGDFVFIGPNNDFGRADGSNSPIPKTIKVLNSRSNITGRNGISCVGCEDVLVDHVSFGPIGYVGFDLELEASTWYGRNIRLTNTTWGDYGLKWFNSSGSGSDVTDLTIANNTMTKRSNCQPSIALGGATPHKNIIISGNRLLSYNVGIGINRAENVTVTDNKLVALNGQCGGNGMWGVTTQATGTVTVTGNDFAGSATPFGIGVQEGPNRPGYTVCNNRVPGSDLFTAPKICGAQ